jgi:hypothetical protein
VGRGTSRRSGRGRKAKTTNEDLQQLLGIASPLRAPAAAALVQALPGDDDLSAFRSLEVRSDTAMGFCLSELSHHP